MKAVFVGACARSGTTFLGSMLGTHSRCLATPESKFNMEIYLESVRRSPQIDLMAAFNRMQQHADFKDWGFDLAALDTSAIEKMQEYPELMQWLVRQFAKSIGRTMPEFWIDHTPLNIFYASILFKQYPDAKILHLVRDGRSVASSVLKVEWGPNTANTAAYWWINRVAHGLAAEAFYGPERIRRVRYEDLVLDPQTTLQSVCSFLEIDYEPNMVTGSGFRVPKQVAHIHPYVGSAPNAKRINAWQKELPPRQIEIFESIAGQFLTLLGYELKFGFGARPVTRMELLRLGIQEVYSDQIGNRLYRPPTRETKRKPSSNEPVAVP